MNTMVAMLSTFAFALLLPSGTTLAFSTGPCDRTVQSSPSTCLHSLSRREALAGFAGAALISGAPNAATADVWSGNELPKGAAQFNRIIRLRSDLKKVKRRVVEGGSEIDKAEWENISKFLRTAYATGDDMKDVSLSIKNPDNKTRALEDIDQLRKYAQAADVSVGKQDSAGFVAIAEKMEFFVQDYFDALTDVPDEI